MSETPKRKPLSGCTPGSLSSVDLSGVLKSAVGSLAVSHSLVSACWSSVTYRNTLRAYYIVSGSEKGSDNLQLELLTAHREGVKHNYLRIDEVKQSHYPVPGPQ